MCALPDTAPASSEPHRRQMLARSDRLLRGVGAVALSDEVQVPPTLRDAIRALQLRIGPESANPRTVRGAQLLVFAVQQRLMGANPHNPHPRAHVGRAPGTPRRDA